jgi:hypothetical protein
MTINRTQAAAHLDSQFSVLASEIGQVTTDDTALGYGPDIDQALRKLGKSEDAIATATVANSDAAAYLALAEYYALRRFWRALAIKITMSVDGIGSASESHMFDHLSKLVEEAAEVAAGLGYPVGAVPTWSLGSINLDFIEPEPG